MASPSSSSEEAHSRASDFLDRTLRRDPKTTFLLKAMAESGCSVDPEKFFTVEHCDSAIAGGFRPTSGVVVCSNHVQTQEEVDNLVAHELIHAYDHCRGANLDWNDCRHHTCSEIRAASLSGDCQWLFEALRGNFGLHKQHQACVRRRAKLSIAMNPACGDPDDQEKAVDECFERCFADTAPFDRIP